MDGGVGYQLENALLYFILALISAGVGYFGGHGKQQLLTSIAYAPLFLIALFGFIQIFNADPAEAQNVADAQIANVTGWFTNNLPGFVIDDVANLIIYSFAGVLGKYR